MNDGRRRWGGVALLLLAWSLLTVGSPGSATTFFPAALLALQLVVALAGPGPGLALAVGLVGLDLRLYVTGALAAPELVARSGFLAVFAGSFGWFWSGEVRRLRTRHRREVEGAVQRWVDEARDYRLIGGVLPPGSRPPRSADEREQLRQIGSVDALRAWLTSLVDVCRSSVGADAVRLFFTTPDGRLREVEPGDAQTSTTRPPFEPSGALAAVAKTGRAVFLAPKSGGPKLGYVPRQPVGAFVAVPVKAGPVVSGVLVAEREGPEPFAPEAEDRLAEAATAFAHAVDMERVFADMDRTQLEQAQLLEALRMVASAIAPRSVAEHLAQATTQLVPADTVAVALWDPDDRVYRVAAALGEETLCARLLDHELPEDGDHLVALALKEHTAMPPRPLSEQADPRDERVLGLANVGWKSVKVFPIEHRRERLGALVVGSTRTPRRLSRDAETMLAAVTTQAAVSLDNARIYERVERMAAHDGLTGLVNHRRFQELLHDAIARAKRQRHPISVVFVDADHFKTINDSFGHPVGDEVLRRIAAALHEEARRVDVVARYGGEEFVLLLEATDTRGATELAERVRARIEGLYIEGDFGRIRVTVSLGVCTFPDLAEDRESLLARADRALYEAKQRGRNQVRVFGAPVCAGGERSDKGRGGGAAPRRRPRVPV